MVAAAVAAVAIWIVGSRLAARPGRVVIDKASGKELTIARRDTFFFIPMRYRAPIILVAGIVLAFAPR
ncbi:MAG: hypothetical protein M3003_01575 [Candidatus Dormibacteraeota bacterium]|nr:hypothetical protein [Candidatus Dormibacteraeota bacterium]